MLYGKIIRNISSNKTLPHLLSFYDCSRKRALGWRTLMLPTKTMSVCIFSFSSHIIYWETKEKAHLIVDDLKYNKVYVFYFISTKHIVTSYIDEGSLVLYGNSFHSKYVLSCLCFYYSQQRKRIQNMALIIAKL